MKFAITTDHHQVFRDFKALVLEELISKDQLKGFSDGVNAAFTHRIGEKWRSDDPSQLFAEGYNLHCDNEGIRRIASQRRLATLISELFECRTVRLGFDQYLPSNKKRLPKEEDPYGEYLRKNGTLKEMSCIQGVLGGMLICLEAPTKQDSEEFFPISTNEVVLFKADKPLPLSFLDQPGAGTYLMITYTEEIAIYKHNPQDPHLHSYKRWGYAYGDKLREPNYPVIIR